MESEEKYAGMSRYQNSDNKSQWDGDATYCSALPPYLALISTQLQLYSHAALCAIIYQSLSSITCSSYNISQKLIWRMNMRERRTEGREEEKGDGK